MKDSFKYAILLLLVSFLIATLCCNSQVFESYSSYPFDKPDEEMQSLENIKNTVFKYNQYVSENNFEREFHDINDFVKLINESKRQDIETAASRFGGVVTAEEDMNDIPFAFRKSPRRNSLSTGPYVEPSYKARSMYREFAKDKWVGDKKKGFRTF